MNSIVSTASTQKMTWKRQIIRLVCLICGIFLGACLMLAFLQRKLIYVPQVGPILVEEAGLSEGRVREVFLQVAKKVVLHGWYCQADQIAQTPKSRLAIVFPGNGGNRLNRVRLLQMINELGSDVLIFDYRGYGGSGGSPTEETIAADSRKVWEFAKNELGFSSDQIVIFGQSLGGGVSTRLVWELCQKEDPPSGLVLQATFTSLVDAAKVHYPWLPVNAVLVDRYPSVERIPDVDCPIMIVHGKKDRVVPFVLGEQLFASAPEKSGNGIVKRFLELPEAGHNDILFVAGDELRSATRQFLDEIDQATLGAD